MIIATFDPGKVELKKTIFRGEDSVFWMSRIFKEVRFFPLDQLDSDFDVLLVFDFSKFIEINSRAVKELIRILSRQQTKRMIFTLKGFPFFALSKPAIKKFQIKMERGICRRIESIDEMTLETLKNSYSVWDISSNFLEIERFVVSNQISRLTRQNVLIDDYRNFFIEGRVEIGRGSRIGSGVVIKGKSKIGKNVILYPNSYIENTIIEDNCVVLPACVLRDSVLEKNVQVGPYTHLRNHAVIRRGAKTGNFVEVKKSILGRGSKSMHLAYLGDATIGENVNIGAGTITCNYDGKEKHLTRIEDNVFIGSGTELVAPIRIGKNSVVGAGSTITDDVPDDSLAIAREPQINKRNWVKKSKKRLL